MLRRTLHIGKKAKKIDRSLRGRSQHLRSWLVLICAVTEQRALLMSFVTSQGADFQDSFREDFLKREGFFSSFLRTKTKMNAGIGKGGGATVAGPLILTLLERKNLILRFLNALPFFIRLPSLQLFAFSLGFFFNPSCRGRPPPPHPAFCSFPFIYVSLRFPSGCSSLLDAATLSAHTADWPGIVV